MNETINQLCHAIKQDARYLHFMEMSKRLNQDHILQLLQDYQNTLKEYEELKQFDSYIDLTQKRKEVQQFKKQIANEPIIQDYYQAYYQINDLLQNITNIIFQGISDEIDTTGITI